MKPEVVRRLLGINSVFYSEFARVFSDTRSERQPSVKRIISLIGDGDKILDVGCGNGRLALALERAGRRAEYRGVDASRELVAIARAQCARLEHVRAEFVVADIAQPGWAHVLGDTPFDAAGALAVLQHIPGFELRVRVLGDIAARVRAGGALIVSNWQFLSDARMRKKIAAWSTAQVHERDLEAGDTLLHWKRGGMGLRYCHLFTTTEMEKLARACDLLVREQFSGENGLNLWSVLKKRPEG